MDTVASADGTVIAFDRYGDGPPVTMTVGAFNTRSQTEPLARALAPRFTAVNYDRRGRGDSGDTAPYAVEWEIDDIAALIQQAGGRASVFGHSSGATLALQAAASGLPITHLVLYEPPFNTDDSYPALPAGFAGELADLVAAGRRGDAVELYQTQAVGIPRGWWSNCGTPRSVPAWRRSRTPSPTTRRSSVTVPCRPGCSPPSPSRPW